MELGKFVRLGLLGSICLLSACQTELSASNLPTPALLNPQTKSFNDTQFEMKSCEITPERTAICKLVVTNRFRDKKFEVSKAITIQDNLGNDYAVTAGGFGEPSNRPQWRQVAVADSSYQMTVIATNLSTKAKSIRAVIFSRLLVRSMQNQTLGYRDQVIFSKPAMVASTQQPPIAPPAVVQQETKNADPSTISPPPTQKPDTWQVVGYWNYDATDGQHVPSQGLVMHNVPGTGLGQQWQAHLELKNHFALSPRNRSLWPVMINTKQRKVCAIFPGYPSYPAFIDMPGESEDGIYQISECNGI